MTIGIPLAMLKQPEGKHEVVLNFSSVRWTMYVDGELLDNDFPLGYPRWPDKPTWKMNAEHVTQAAFFSPAITPEKKAAPTPRLAGVQYWTPPGHNAWVGDVATFFHQGRYQVFYLYDRRHHQSKFGKGALNFESSEELKALRSDHKQFSGIKLSDNNYKILENVKGLQYEISVTFKPGSSGTFGIELLDGAKPAKLVYNVTKKALQFNDISAPLDLKGGNLDLDVFIDAATIEVFANKKVCITNAIQPSSPEGFRIKLFSEAGQATAYKIDVWKMGTIW